MRRNKLTARPIISDQPFLGTLGRPSAAPKKQSPALVNAAWAGWQYEVPADEDGAHSQWDTGVFEKASRTDRVIAEFRVGSAGEAATRINEAVALAELEAYAEQARGVLVTRHDFDLFSVALSSTVPFGVTVEQDSAPHPRSLS